MRCGSPRPPPGKMISRPYRSGTDYLSAAKDPYIFCKSGDPCFFSRCVYLNLGSRAVAYQVFGTISVVGVEGGGGGGGSKPQSSVLDALWAGGEGGRPAAVMLITKLCLSVVVILFYFAPRQCMVLNTRSRPT